jgi:hypothetical protein
MKSISAKLLIVLMAITCLTSCGDKLSSVIISYTITSPTNLLARVSSCYNNGAETVTIPATTEISETTYTVTSIGCNAFQSCSGLTSVILSDSITSVANNAFQGCSNLKTIVVSSGNSTYCSDSGVLFTIKKTTLVEAPGGLSGAYTIPSTVTSIGEVAFENCSSLTSVTIPSSVTSIGNYAFYGCSGLTAIHIKSTNPSSITLGTGVFYVSSACKLYVPSGSKSLYAAAAQWKAFSNIVEE